MSADLLQRLADAGTPMHLIMEVAETLAEARAAERLLEKRREKDRDRKRNSKDSVETAESAESPSPLVSPPKVSPDPFKITPPISPQPTTDRRACRLPDDWVAEPLTGKALAMIERWQPGELEREIAKFKNYWWAKGGKDACKTNWQRTFINWLISADERKPNGNLRQHQPGIGRTAAAIQSLGGWHDDRPM